jgi:molybdopterin-guanine dinucleotide biosynthesis protein A
MISGGQDQIRKALPGGSLMMSSTPSGLGPHVGLILAGGQNTRMGGTEKAMMPLGGKPMLARVIDRLKPQVDRLLLSANGDVQRFSGFAVPVERDQVGEGPLAGLLAGMRWSEENLPDAKFIVSVAADTPFFPADLVERLSEGCGRDENTVALAASSAGTHPVFGLWPLKLADGLEKYLKSGAQPKVLAFADRFMRLNVPFDDIILPNGEAVDPFFNVNTPEEAKSAEAIVAALEGRGGGSPAGD